MVKRTPGSPSYGVTIVRGLGPERDQWERRLAENGFRLPLPQRGIWAEMDRRGDGWLFVATDESGRALGAVGVEIAPSRALPWRDLLRCERTGPGLDATVAKTLLRAIKAEADENRRVLRVHVETFCPKHDRRAEYAAALKGVGFSRPVQRRSYSRTLVIELSPEESVVFASLHATARRHIRAARRGPVALRAIANPAEAASVERLHAESFARTGGRRPPIDWRAVIDLSRREPEVSRVVGLYRTDEGHADELIAFAWGCAHGDHAHYAAAGSARPEDLRIPLTYALVWDLIVWAKENGAFHFDLGGVSDGAHGGDDPLGGVSDFKRYFSRTQVEVGAEWVYEPRPWESRVARAISGAGALGRRALDLVRGP